MGNMIRAMILTALLAGCDGKVLQIDRGGSEGIEYLVVLPLCLAGCSSHITGIGSTTAETTGSITTPGHSVSTSTSSSR